ncbi:MAG: DUF3472 domain-containing protein [Prevotellaceae bacterium]|jgi:hypothetical protein|nr:DUF3472 domain-containing protein [Prevotellaceae bacterium]
MKICKNKLGIIFLSVLALASAIAVTFAACSKDDAAKVEPAPAASAKAKAIPLRGNTWVTSGTSTIDRDSHTITWLDPNTVYTVYFRVNEGGDLRLYLRYTNPKGSRESAENSLITATVGTAPSVGEAFAGAAYSIALPKSPTPTKDTTVFICRIDGCPEGYLRVDLKGEKRVGEVFAVLSALVADGDAAQSLAYSPSNRTNAPSVHMGYTLPSNETVEWFYNEVTVPDGMDQPATYFMVNGFKEGYSGIQPQPTATNDNPKVRVLFSVWAPYNTDNPADVPDDRRVPCLAIGDGVCYQMFGGEGSGTQTFYSGLAGWRTGATYKFLVRICPAATFDPTLTYVATDHVAYIYDPVDSKWKLIAHLRRPYPSNGWTSYHDAYSFLEDFGGLGTLTRKVSFGNQWARTAGENARWIEVTEGGFSTDGSGSAGHRLDYKGGVENGKFFLQNGGFFSDNAKPGTKFTREPTGIEPDIDFAALEQLRVEGAARVTPGAIRGGKCD